MAKGQGKGGTRWISIPGWQGFVTRKLNPWRREQKRLMREAGIEQRRQRQAKRAAGFSLVVRSLPCAIPESGRAAQARQLDVSWNEPDRVMQRMRNRCQTKIRQQKSRKQTREQFGSLERALTVCVQRATEESALIGA